MYLRRRARGGHQRVDRRPKRSCEVRKQTGVHERTLEMVSQAREISLMPTASALEAALAEPDEIKPLRPPYNIALTDGEPRAMVCVARSGGAQSAAVGDVPDGAASVGDHAR
jgi:excinuclease UvrABC nuclease subunit